MNAGTLTTLTNGGAIIGGNGGSGLFFGGMGGVGVSNSGTVRTLTNSGTISGGAGGGGDTSGAVGFGGSGIVEFRHDQDAHQQRDDQRRTRRLHLSGGAGGAGVWNSSTIRTLTNSGTISGGVGGGTTSSANDGGAGGAGVLNAKGATIGSLSNAAARRSAAEAREGATLAAWAARGSGIPARSRP